MSTYSSNDVSFSIVPEVTLGTTPTTGADRFALPAKVGNAVPQFKAKEIASDTLRPNRSSNGSRRDGGSGSGSFEFRFQEDEAIELLMASALGGTWTEVGEPAVSTLIGGKTDTYFSIIAALSSGMYETSAGGVVSGFTLAAKAADAVTANFDFIFTKRGTSTTNNPLTVTESAGNAEFIGTEVTNLNVAGQTLKYTELTFSVNQNRSPLPVLGSSNPVGIASTGTREVKITLKAYRESFAIDSAITGTPQTVSFEIGTVGNGYRFTLPAAYGMVPYTESGDSLMVVLEFSAGYDDTINSNVKIEKL